MNFASRIAEAAARWPDRTAIEVLRADGIEVVRYRDLIGQAKEIGAWLRLEGFAKGDRAAILADNDARWVATYLGILWVGGVVVPLDTAYKSGQVQTVLSNSGAEWLFVSDKYRETARAAGAARIEGVGGVFHRFGPTGAGGRPANGPTSGTEMPESVENTSDPLDAAVILYTSGTTADPKGVVLTHANLEAERVGALSIVKADERDAVLGVLPLFHALAQMANLLLPLSVGARVVFLESVNSSTLLAALQSRGITLFACVPQFFYLIHQRVRAEVARGGLLRRALFRALVDSNIWLRNHAGWNPGRLLFAKVHRVLGRTMRMLITGGSRFDPSIGRDLYGIGFTLLNAYGLTETSGGATIVRPTDRFTTSVGQPFPGVEIKINFELQTSNFEETPHGEIWIRGAIVMREYYHRPDATAEALIDGWLHTGDLGRLDADGRLYITGRKKEIIVLSSGKNLYPEEIEAHYRQTPFIKELCVMGLARPDEPAAERLHAVIVPDEAKLRERGTVNFRELIRFELESLSVQLPAHKRILSYDITLDALPRTTTGKLKRPEIERLARQLHASRVTGADERPLTPAEQEWLAPPEHQSALTAIAARLDRPPAVIRPDANLELDLGLDSMERVELLTSLEQHQGTRVSAEVRATIFTVRQLVDAVEAGERVGNDPLADSPPDAAATWDSILSEPPDPFLVANLSRPKTAVAVFCFVVLRIFRLFARLLLGFRATGQSHLPREGAFIISPNHQTYVDGLFLASALPYWALRRLFFVGAAEFYQTPIRAWLGRLVNIVPVDPDANLVTAMRAGATGLRLKKILILFPEGERSIDGELKPFRKGAAILSSHLGAPIVPLAIDGIFELWPRGRPLNWKGLWPGRTRVSARFGPAISTDRGRYAEGTTALRRAVEAELAGMRD
jgi:long-chain acyl-CoA synthetase